MELNLDREEHGQKPFPQEKFEGKDIGSISQVLCLAQNCPMLSQCSESKNQHHIWEGYVEEAEHLRHSHEIKQIYARRKETIERVFADAKEKLGMR